MREMATVLLVDDDPGMVETAAAFVERASDDVTVTTATDPDAALDLFEELDVDCIVSDYNMPGMDGLALFEAVTERDPGTPFILFTGKGSEEVASEAISLGVTDYLQKETGTEQYEVLANRIENAIEARHAERQLERSEERYQHLVESSPAGVVITSLDDSIVYANEAAASFIGADGPEAVHGLSTLDLVHPEDEATLRERWTGSRESEPREPIEQRFVGFDGETRHAVVASTPITYEGEPAVQSVLTDVTEHREREHELERYETVMEVAPVGVFVLDAEGTITWCNERATALVGHTAAELTGDPFVSVIEEGIVPEAAISKYRAVLRDLLSASSDRTTGQYTIPITHPERDERVLRIHVSLLPSDGEFRGAVLVGQDVTERNRYESALERERDRLSALFENVSDAVFRYEFEAAGEAGRIRAVNPAFESVFGYDEHEVVGERIAQTIVPADRLAEYEDVVARAGTGDLVNVAVECETATGRRTFLLRNASMTETAEDGRVAGYAILTDITERREDKRDLQRERNTLAALFENIPDPVYRHDLDDDVLVPKEVNPAFEQVFGYEPERVLDRPVTETIVPADRVEKHRQLVAASRSGASLDTEVERLTAAGRRTFLLRNVPISGPDEESPEGSQYAIYTDITPQKRRERVLLDLHDRTREMMGAEGPAAVASIAMDATEDLLDRSVASLWLYDEDTGTLRPAALTDDEGTAVEALPTYEPGDGRTWEVFETGDAYSYDADDTDDCRSETPVQSGMVLPLGEYGVMNVGTTTPGEFDETDEALTRLLATTVEAALERAERERERAARKRLLERQNDQLEAFASVLSHDLRSPLAVASGRLELLETETDSEHTRPIADALDRMDTLIEECLTFARQGQIVTDSTRVDVEATAERAWRTVETGGTELTVEDLDPAEADDDRLRTLFENLFRNAIEHGDATAVRVGPLDDAPGFYVADDGSGIPESEREAVFERGYSTNEAGTGLGLAIVDTLADAHGWEVTVVDGTAGARFEVNFSPEAPLPTPQ